MMRSLYSGVSGLKTHQTKMDVIGNNIANVNTTAYKTKSITFSDMLYQTTQAASGPDPETQKAGTNARQIGLGVKSSAISTAITTEGATQSTGNPFDLKITGEAFFVVSDGTNTYFTRDGSFNVDANGYLAMAGTGYNVMGWTTVDKNTGEVMPDTVKPIRVMGEGYQTYGAEATTQAYLQGILDKFDDNLETNVGKQINLQIFDKLGYEYNVKFGITPMTGTVQSTKSVTNTERMYDLPTKIEVVDNSTLTFRRQPDNVEITKTSIPEELLSEIEEKARDAYDADPDNLVNPVTVAINKYPTDENGNQVTQDANQNNIILLDMGDALPDSSQWNGAAVTVTFSGEKAYKVYNENGVSLGVMDIDDEILQKLYGDDAGNALANTFGEKIGETASLLPIFANGTSKGIIATQKTYTDGTDPQYEYFDLEGNKILLDDEAISKLLATDASPEVLSQYTSTEDTTVDEVLDGQYQVKLLSMTDSNQTEVDLNAFGADGLSYNLVYNVSDGTFNYVGAPGSKTITVNLSALGTNFENLEIDFSTTENTDNGGSSTVAATKGDLEGLYAGRKVGEMTGVSIGTDGTIYATYSNGQSKILAQIAVATFANAMGLANAGDNLYEETQNSGSFDGVGVDITAGGTGYLTTGVLEMSNVDLSAEFTEMITTQRGFQANSRIITVSDTLLEELVNLKR